MVSKLADVLNSELVLGKSNGGIKFKIHNVTQFVQVVSQEKNGRFELLKIGHDSIFEDFWVK